jgi:hypothetical protein
VYSFSSSGLSNASRSGSVLFICSITTCACLVFLGFLSSP